MTVIDTTMPAVGDPAPVFGRLPSTGDKPLGPEDWLGKPLVLFFYVNDGSPSCTADVCGFRSLYDEFARLGVRVAGVGVEPQPAQRALATQLALPFPLLSDASGQVFAAYGLGGRATGGTATAAPRRATFLVAPSRHVTKSYADTDARPGTLAAQVLADARRLLCREEPRVVVGHAPVLLIPNVLPPELCRTLMDLWETENEDSGSMVTRDGKTVEQFNYSHKIRRDHFMTRDTPARRELAGYIGRRVLPEIRIAFHYEVTRKEDFRVACYDAARGGYFRPHRDNTTGGTAHRRFAMSLLLNDDYEGGHLRFPEYAPHLYRPDAGGAVVFSCTLLHEALDVTAGRRFVLLSFFYGEREAREREEHNRRTGGDYRA